MEGRLARLWSPLSPRNNACPPTHSMEEVTSALSLSLNNILLTPVHPRLIKCSALQSSSRYSVHSPLSYPVFSYHPRKKHDSHRALSERSRLSSPSQGSSVAATKQEKDNELRSQRLTRGFTSLAAVQSISRQVELERGVIAELPPLAACFVHPLASCTAQVPYHGKAKGVN